MNSSSLSRTSFDVFSTSWALLVHCTLSGSGTVGLYGRNIPSLISLVRQNRSTVIGMSPMHMRSLVVPHRNVMYTYIPKYAAL